MILIEATAASSHDRQLKELELYLLRTARQHDPNTLYRLRTVPGIGKILSLVLLYEIHDIHRFPHRPGLLVLCSARHVRPPVRWQTHRDLNEAFDMHRFLVA